MAIVETGRGMQAAIGCGMTVGSAGAEVKPIASGGHPSRLGLIFTKPAEPQV